MAKCSVGTRGREFDVPCWREAEPGKKTCAIHLARYSASSARSARKRRDQTGHWRKKKTDLAPFLLDSSLLPKKPPGKT